MGDRSPPSSIYASGRTWRPHAGPSGFWMVRPGAPSLEADFFLALRAGSFGVLRWSVPSARLAHSWGLTGGCFSLPHCCENPSSTNSLRTCGLWGTRAVSPGSLLRSLVPLS